MNKDELLDFLSSLEDLENDDERFTALFRMVDEQYHEVMSSLNNDDFEVDHEMMGHFTSYASFITDIVKESNGYVEMDVHEPKEGIIGITAYLRVFWISGDTLREFCKQLVWATSISIDALTDGTVCISTRFTGVYRRKQS